MDSGQGTLQAAEPNAIETTALTRRFGDMTAVDHIDVRIPYGQIFGLLGPNGAGKSTTIKMLTTLLDPSSGTAVVAGFSSVAALGLFVPYLNRVICPGAKVRRTVLRKASGPQRSCKQLSSRWAKCWKHASAANRLYSELVSICRWLAPTVAIE